MILRTVLLLVVIVFPLSEIAIAILKRSGRSAGPDDRGSMRLLWVVIAACVVTAAAVSGIRWSRLPVSAPTGQAIALGLLVGGLALRWAAIRTLGRFFTADIAVTAGQPVIDTGPFRCVRHPSYAGLLLAFAGLGVFFGSWLSVAVLVIPISLAVVHRINLEEQVLTRALGPAYVSYCSRTKRIIPGVF